MDSMIAFSAAMLGLLADFLASEPIIYLFGLVCFCFVVKVVKTLLPSSSI